MRQTKCDLDLVGGRKPRMTVRVDAGDGPEELELLEPRRLEARALDACADAARAAESGGGSEFVDVLYATAAVILSRNSQGREFSFEDASDALTVREANSLVAAYASMKARQEDALGNA